VKALRMVTPYATTTLGKPSTQAYFKSGTDDIGDRMSSYTAGQNIPRTRQRGQAPYFFALMVATALVLIWTALCAI
jgi:hypothetical protein